MGQPGLRQPAALEIEHHLPYASLVLDGSELLLASGEWSGEHFRVPIV
jgi:hypothetical protein